MALLEKVIGHSAQKQRLKSALQQGRLHPVQLFTGPSGVGKKSTARAIVQCLFCTQAEAGLACGQCGDCKKVEQGQHENLLEIEPENHVIKVEKAREIIEFLNLKEDRKKGILIDEAQFLNMQAANTLLKVLEEAAENIYFFLISSNLVAILPTIRSRAQALRFSPLSQQDLASLETFEPWILQASRGSVEQARFLQQEEGFQARGFALSLLKSFLQNFNSQTSLDGLKEISKDKGQVAKLTLSLQWVIHQAFVVRSGGRCEGDPELVEICEHIGQNPQYDLSSWSLSVMQLEKDLQTNVDKMLSFENFLIQIKASIAQ